MFTTYVLECGTVGEREDGVRVTALSLTSAADTTAIGLESTVESASDLLGFREGLSTSGGWNGDGSALGKAGEGGGSFVGGAGSGSGGESQEESSDGSLHLAGYRVGSW
jgi:hypothetical protein